MIRHAVTRCAMVGMLFAALLAVSVQANAAKGASHRHGAKHAVKAAIRAANASGVIASGRTTTASTPVALQRLSASGGKTRWQTVARSRARHHQFTLKAAQRMQSARYRVVSKWATSKAVVVALPKPKPKPKPKPAPKPAPQPTPADEPAVTVPDPAQPADPEPTTVEQSRTATPTPADDSAADCGGTVLKADGTPWQCTFDDEFDGTTLDAGKWVPQQYFFTGNLLTGWVCYEDDPDLISVSGGSLHLSVDKPKPTSIWAPYCKYTAGMVSTYGLFDQKYGRFEARVRPSAYSGPGLHEAFWMWPSDPAATSATWPASGEIDVAETWSGLPDVAIPYLHYTANDNGGYVPGVNTAFDCAATRGQYNTYTLEWTPTKLTFIINGRTCLVNTSADPAFQQAYRMALTQGLDLESNNAATADTPVPSTMDVDYVRVWK